MIHSFVAANKRFGTVLILLAFSLKQDADTHFVEAKDHLKEFQFALSFFLGFDMSFHF